MEKELADLITSELDKLFRFAYNRTNDVFKAEDLTQEIVLTAIRSYQNIREKERILPWLWGIARNVCMRTKRFSCEIPTDDLLIVSRSGTADETPETEYLRKSDISKVRRAVSYLAKNYRDVCILYWLEGKDYNTVARELSIPLSSVKWRLNQSKSQLREEIEKMEYMENGYCKAKKLTLCWGGYLNRCGPKNSCLNEAQKALESLLAQNIAIAAYQIPKTVTEISSELGVSADYIEDALGKLVRVHLMKQIGNRYRTMFLILDETAGRALLEGSDAFTKIQAASILQSIYALEEKIRSIGFRGSDKPFDRLLLMLTGTLCLNTEQRHCGTDKGWFLLGTTYEAMNLRESSGIYLTGYPSLNLREYYFSQNRIPDLRGSKQEAEAFRRILDGESVQDAPSIALLLQKGKIKKEAPFLVTVPVLDERNGEYRQLLDVLAPVRAQMDALQNALYQRCLKIVKKQIPAHLAEGTGFFSGCCAHSLLETAFYEALKLRGIEITQDMVLWCTIT